MLVFQSLDIDSLFFLHKGIILDNLKGEITMKKVSGLLMTLLLIFFLSSCASNQNNESSQSIEPQENSEALNEETVNVVENESEEEDSKDDDMTKEDEAMEEEMTSEMKEFNAEELSKYNGKDGNPAYVAYDGKVYDVTNIRAWKNGLHQGKLEAGKDYTDVLNNKAPHPPSNLTDNAPVVGIYKE